mgnify:CR=1 FL=1
MIEHEAEVAEMKREILEVVMERNAKVERLNALGRLNERQSGMDENCELGAGESEGTSEGR